MDAVPSLCKSDTILPWNSFACKPHSSNGDLILEIAGELLASKTCLLLECLYYLYNITTACLKLNKMSI